ncbi:ABC transporter permease [Sporosarcina sp. Marseille-Q4063]|uniref:ABC transporter permease n=1 Tax=Sporosarcina sp. Marseille-Q4063 TaxID=2810514 RepID=UPI001BB04053|nr:ABC transporter permease [Sporosarcina sp. Marseille-Q4063]QUW23449.1 ABC transporter permease [Sporosarcina sp. Marseille-Q4063]
MREFLIIFKQAFMTKLKTKSFILTTAFMIAAVFLFANMTSIIDTVTDLTGGGEDEIYVVDESGELSVSLKEKLDATNSGIVVKTTTESEKALTEKVSNEEIDSFLVIGLDAENTIQADYTSLSALDFGRSAMIMEALQSIQSELKAEQLSLSPDQLQTLFSPIQFEQHSVSTTTKSEEELSEARGLVYILVFLIYFTVIFYSNMIATEVATEKSSRVMEILISSISPVKHMFAKVLGIGSLGLVQMMLLGIAGFIAVKTSASNMVEGVSSFFGFSNLSVSTIVFAVIFFLLGYFLYATVAALLGSLVSRTEDVQQAIMPIMILVILAFMIAMPGLTNPELGFLKYASYVPFFAPLVMFLRVGMLDLPLWEPLLSIAIMLVTILILGVFGARVYRGGVLMYGPSRSLKDIKKAIQLGKE